MLRRKFPQPEQAVNGEATKVLMKELDCQETYAKLGVDTGNLLEQHVMSLINGGGSCVFRMPFIDSDKSLHKSGEWLNEFDLIINQSNSYPDAKFSNHMKLHFNSGSFKLLIPGKDIDDNVCDLCINW